MLKVFLQIICLVLPWKVRRRVLNLLPGFAIDAKARVGFSLLLARQVRLSAGASIGHLNYVGRLDHLQMDEDASIGNLNWISGLAYERRHQFFLKNSNRSSDFVMRRSSMIGNQHLLDCTDRIEVGAYALIAGYRTQLLTHGIEPIASRQTCAPILIGDYSMIGSGSLIMKGVHIPRCCLVSAGAVVRRARPEPYSLIAGNPAVHVRCVPETAKLFSRTSSIVY